MKITTLLRSQVTAVLALTLLLALFVPAMMAQSSGTSGLTGTITDPSGAAVPNVTVTLTSNSTGQVRNTTTGTDGAYKFSLLPPGDYKIRFAASGFKTAEIASIVLNVTETPALDRVLEVGAQTEQVTVEAAAETLQTQSSTLGAVIGQQAVTGLPLSSRNYTQILGLEAGANSNANNATALGKGTLDMAVNGNGTDQNNFQMDGISVVNAFGAGVARDCGIYVGIPIPNPDAIQEFKVQTSTYDASYGRNPGANVNVVTKSGTNSFHGTLFEFFRNSDLDANDFFYNRDTCSTTFAGQSCPHQVLKQNQFGGTFGGPIKKDKLFFFGSYQGTRQRNGIAPGGASTPILPPIPAGDRSGPGFRAALGAAMCPANHPGNPSYITGFGIFSNEIQMDCAGNNISQTALNILNVKLPNGQYYLPGSTTGGFQQVEYSLPSIYTGDQYLANADYLISSKNTLAMRYFFTEDPQQSPFSISNIPGTPVSSYYANTDSSIKLTTLVTNTFINELHGSVERNIANGHDTAPYTNQQVGITGIVPQETLPPAMVLIGSYNIGGTLAPYVGPATQIQYGDQISWSHGKHNIRAGFEYEWLQWNLSFASLLRGFLFSPGFNDFLIGRPGCGDPSCSGNYTTGTTGAPLGTWTECLFCVRSGPNGIIHAYREHDMSAFVQDDWKVSSKLTVNIGVRWEYDGAFGDALGNLTNVWPSLMAGVTPPTTSQSSGTSLIGYVVPSNFASHYGAPPAGVTTVNSQFPTQNSVPLSDFGPRLGFAWQPLDKGKLVIRGGAGLFYDRVGSSKFVHAVEQGDPYALTLDYSGPGAVPYSLANPFPSTPLGFTPRYFDPATGANSSLNTPFYQTIHTPLTRQYNLGCQYEFIPQWVLEVGFVGSSGINQADYNHNYNLAQLASPSNPINGQTTNTVANSVYRVPYLGYQPIGLQGTEYDAGYHYTSLQATLRKQFSHGLNMQAAFTWSKDLSNLQECGPTGCVGDGQANSNLATNLAQQQGPAAFSHPLRFVLSYNYLLPFGNPSGVLGVMAKGWSVSGTTIAQNGTPLTFTDTNGGTAYYGGANPGSGEGGSSRSQLCPGMTYSTIGSSGGVESRLGGNSGGPGWTVPGAFCAPPVAPYSTDGSTLFGDSGIGIILGPGQVNYDISLQKITNITEKQQVLFRAEFFNAFNHPQFSNPVTTQNTEGSTFGVIQTLATNPRIIQFALKYIF
jgi:Carboxypeptidase regulatory-like domain